MAAQRQNTNTTITSKETKASESYDFSENNDSEFVVEGVSANANKSKVIDKDLVIVESKVTERQQKRREIL